MADLARVLLAHPRTSSMSEFVFSYGGVETSGRRSQLSADRLNAREIIKFNHGLVKQEEWDKISEQLPKLREFAKTDYGLRRDLHFERNYLRVSVTCAFCLNSELKKEKVTTALASRLRCDNYPECKRNSREIPEVSFFYGCTNCDKYDICEECFQEYDKQVKEVFQQSSKTQRNQDA